MLEQLVNASQRRTLARVHPSSESVFSDNPYLERAADAVRQNIVTNHFPPVGYLSLGVIYGTYGTIELASRVTETALRFAGRTLEGLCSVTNQAVQSIRPINQTVRSYLTSVQSFLHRMGRGYNSFTRELEMSFPLKIRDRSMVGLSLLAAGFISAYALGSGSDDPLLIQQPSVTERATPEQVSSEEREPLSFSPNQTPNAPAPIIRTRVEPIPLSPISEFDDSKVLIYCANEYEKDYVDETLGRRGFNLVSQREGIWRTTLGDSEIRVIIFGYPIPRVNEGYGIIQLRGHTYDMNYLFQQTQEYKRGKVLYLLGGCNGADFIPEMANENLAVIGSHGTRHGIQNTDLLVQLLLHFEEFRNWSDLSLEMRRRFPRNGRDTDFPGDEEYVRRVPVEESRR